MFSRSHCCPVPSIHSLDKGRRQPVPTLPPWSTRPTSSSSIRAASSGGTGVTSSESRRRRCGAFSSIARGRQARREAWSQGGCTAQHTEPEARQHPFDLDVLALDGALSRLETLEPRWARLVELRFCAGLSIEETAAVVGISPATVKRDWHLARAWRGLRRIRGTDGRFLRRPVRGSRQSLCLETSKEPHATPRSLGTRRSANSSRRSSTGP